MNLKQRSRTPIIKINYPLINFEQLKKEQQYLDQAFLMYDTYQHEVFNSLRQIGKTIDLAPNPRKPFDKLNLQSYLNYISSEIIERPKPKKIVRNQKEYLNCTFSLTRPELIWGQTKSCYGKKNSLIRPARHPLKIQQSLDLNSQQYKRLLNSKLRNWV